MPFLVYALPRSRTAWLAEFLNYGDWVCQHEFAQYMRSIEDIRNFFRHEKIGSVETGAAPGRAIIKSICPPLKEVVILRPVEEVIDSLMALEATGLVRYDHQKLRKGMEYCDRVLKKIALSKGVLTVQYDDLGKDSACTAIFEHCLGREFDSTWWNDLKDRNIQEDHRRMVEYRLRNRPAIMEFKDQCKRELRRLCRIGVPLRDLVA